MKSYGQIAYEAYVADCGGVSVHGEPLPNWDDQAPAVRSHWEVAGRAVIDALVKSAAMQPSRRLDA
jgi:hypothetical protein